MKKFLTKKQVAYIKTHAKKGKSLNQISKDLKIPKTTAYWWFRKTVGKKIHPVKIDTKNRESLGEIVGAFCGDGNFFFNKKTYNYRITFSLGENENEYASLLSGILEKSFSRKPHMWHNKKYHVCCVVIHGKEIYKFLLRNLTWNDDKTLTVRLRNNIGSYDSDFMKGFIRGLFDTDGYIDSKGDVGVAVISKELINQASSILETFGIENQKFVWKQKEPRRDLFGIRIPKSSSRHFVKTIGFTNPYKLEQFKKHQ